MKTTGQIIGESDGDYRKYLQNLVNGQKTFLDRLEAVADQHHNLLQDIAPLVAKNKILLEEYQERLRGELNRALSSQKD